MRNLRHIFLTIGILSILISSCSQSLEMDADYYLKQARTEYRSGNLKISRDMIDSLRSKFPTAYPQIRASFLLTDSIEYANCKIAVESLSERITQLQIELKQAPDKNSKATLATSIDRLRSERDSCRATIDQLEGKALKNAAKCQCKITIRK